MEFIFSKELFFSKPQTAAALQQPYNYLFLDLDIRQIGELIGQGAAWRAAVYEKNTTSFRKLNAIGSYILALDFDNCKYQPSEVCEYAVSIGIQPTMWYYSYSQGKKEGFNFRVLWVLSSMITPNQYENIYKNMLDKFAAYNPDSSTKDCSRLWYGCRTGVNIINDKPIPLSVIGFLGVATKLEEKKQLQNIKAAVKNCEKEYFTAAQDDTNDYIITADGFKWWEQLGLERCWLWKQWQQGKYLNYNQRLTLFTNLKQLKYSNHKYSVVKDVMSFYNEETYKGHTCNEAQIRTMFSQSSLHPIGIVSVEGQQNLITVKQFFERYATNEVKNTIEKISLEELDKRLDADFPHLLAASGITYIKAQPASGKTYRVIQYLVNEVDLSKQKIIYAVPTYNNIDEFSKRFLDAAAKSWGGSFFVPPDIITTIPRGNYNARDLLLLELGLKAETKQETRLAAIVQMMDYSKKGLFVATHQLLAHLKGCQADLIIVDENIEECLRYEVIMDSTEIAGLRPHSEEKYRDRITKLSDELAGKDYGDIDISVIKEAINEKQNTFNWDSYTSSKNIIKGIGMLRHGEAEQARVVKRNKQPVIRVMTRSTLIADAIENNTPIKLLSATPLSETLKALYDTDKIEVFEFPVAANKGKIIQYEKETAAKTDGEGRLKVAPLIRYIKEKLTEKQIKDSYVLTFDAFISDFIKAGFNIPMYNQDYLHIANVAGLDTLRGKNIIIAAKFDMNDEYYKNLYLDIHGSLEGKSFNRQWVVEKINGREKRLYLLEDEELRKIQKEQINRYLEQAAGRARALREKGVKVYLFCDFPLADSDEYIY